MAWIVYWDKNAIKIQGPPAGSYSGMGIYYFFFGNAGANAYLMKYGPTATSAAVSTIGPWKKPSATLISGDVIQIKCEKISGDVDNANSSTFNTFLSLYPNETSDYPRWAAENSTGTKKAVLKFTLKDEDNNTIIWWARVVHNGVGEISYSPLELNPSSGGGGTDPGGDPSGGGGDLEL
jgi:hypothetical protein